MMASSSPILVCAGEGRVSTIAASGPQRDPVLLTTLLEQSEVQVLPLGPATGPALETA